MGPNKTPYHSIPDRYKEKHHMRNKKPLTYKKFPYSITFLYEDGRTTLHIRFKEVLIFQRYLNNRRELPRIEVFQNQAALQARLEQLS